MIELDRVPPYFTPMMANDPHLRARDRARLRFERQIHAIERAVPALQRPLKVIRARGWWIVRLPLGLLFIAGGFLAILPVFGLWMIPLGLLLLAIDLPQLRAPVSGWIIRMRRRVAVWRHNGKNRR